MRWISRCVAIVYLLHGAMDPQPSFAQTPGAIEGVVYDGANGHPLSGVSVALFSPLEPTADLASAEEHTEQGNVVRSAQGLYFVTDTQGFYRITPVAPGNYLLTFKYAEMCQHVSVAVGEEGNVLNQVLDVDSRSCESFVCTSDDDCTGGRPDPVAGVSCRAGSCTRNLPPRPAGITQQDIAFVMEAARNGTGWIDYSAENDTSDEAVRRRESISVGLSGATMPFVGRNEADVAQRDSLLGLEAERLRREEQRRQEEAAERQREEDRRQRAELQAEQRRLEAERWERDRRDHEETMARLRERGSQVGTADDAMRRMKREVGEIQDRARRNREQQDHRERERRAEDARRREREQREASARREREARERREQEARRQKEQRRRSREQCLASAQSCAYGYGGEGVCRPPSFTDVWTARAGQVDQAASVLEQCAHEDPFSPCRDRVLRTLPSTATVQGWVREAKRIASEYLATDVAHRNGCTDMPWINWFDDLGKKFACDYASQCREHLRKSSEVLVQWGKFHKCTHDATFYTSRAKLRAAQVEECQRRYGDD